MLTKILFTKRFVVLLVATSAVACDPCCQPRTTECQSNQDCPEGDVCDAQCGGCIPDEDDGE